MGLADDLGAPIERSRTRPCEFALWLASLTETEQDAVRAALKRPPGDPLYWSSPKLWARLAAAGYTGSQATVHKHRGSECQTCR